MNNLELKSPPKTSAPFSARSLIGSKSSNNNVKRPSSANPKNKSNLTSNAKERKKSIINDEQNNLLTLSRQIFKSYFHN